MISEQVLVPVGHIAALAGVTSQWLRRRLFTEERLTGSGLVHRVSPRGRCYTSISACRSLFGEDFLQEKGTSERIAELEKEVVKLRRELRSLRRTAIGQSG